MNEEKEESKTDTGWSVVRLLIVSIIIVGAIIWVKWPSKDGYTDKELTTVDIVGLNYQVQKLDTQLKTMLDLMPDKERCRIQNSLDKIEILNTSNLSTFYMIQSSAWHTLCDKYLEKTESVYKIP